ncbi:LysE family translocator [Marivita hallyeonensis]|uniref:Threonine/homoserine/homoserine lactone efflux protein n=1 Tax=Marivita hallyeonensis TaxID=996342 RepID=A0A1M5PA39_9RHOB|nr:LysE family translocator [Marivita hallyeonensis]SHG98694.1 Threonine/homoserine/homoserine lactone efflux protein [Marivita hallyeonensis]
MTYETWLAFTLASAIVVLIPGPNIVLTVNYAIRDGKRSGLATIPGVVTGAFIAMSLSLLGAGAVLATSVFLFTLLKLAGAFYLLWLAYTLWTAPVATVSLNNDTPAKPLSQLFWQSMLISVLNPKGPAFYVAFVPQFVTPGGPVFQQFAILIATFLVVATLNSLFWLIFASSLRRQFTKPHAMRLLNRIGASCLCVAGLFTLKATRST